MWWVEQVELSESLEHIMTLTDGLVALPQNGWCEQDHGVTGE